MIGDKTIWPSHAYVPTKTPRHADGAFDVIRDTAQAGMTPDQLAGCDAFQYGLRYLDAGYFWEAHEVLEPVWMLLPDPSPERSFVQGLIQIANGFLKLKMEKPKAAGRLAGIARGHVPLSVAGFVMGVDAGEIQQMIVRLSAKSKSAI